LLTQYHFSELEVCNVAGASDTYVNVVGMISISLGIVSIQERK